MRTVWIVRAKYSPTDGWEDIEEVGEEEEGGETEAERLRDEHRMAYPSGLYKVISRDIDDAAETEPTYTVRRSYQAPDLRGEVVMKGLTLAEAQAHCTDPQSSSATAPPPKASPAPSSTARGSTASPRRTDMPALPELMDRDSVTATWFWTTSHDIAAYTENEGFDVVFVRETNYVVGGGYYERRTLYVQDIHTAGSKSRRNNGGDIIEGDPVLELAHLLTQAADVDNYPTFGEWVRECRNAEGEGVDLDLETFELMLADFTRLTAQAAELRVWLGDQYDEYVKAAQKWAEEH